MRRLLDRRRLIEQMVEKTPMGPTPDGPSAMHTITRSVPQIFLSIADQPTGTTRPRRPNALGVSLCSWGHDRFTNTGREIGTRGVKWSTHTATPRSGCARCAPKPKHTPFHSHSRRDRGERWTTPHAPRGGNQPHEKSSLGPHIRRVERGAQCRSHIEFEHRL